MDQVKQLKRDHARLVRDDIWLCGDCLLAAVNGDAHEDEARDLEIASGLEALGPGLVPDFDCDTQAGIREFSRHGCDCCRSRLGGQLHRFAVLGALVSASAAAWGSP